MSLIQPIIFFFFSQPGFAWQACLKMTAAELELLTDLIMLLTV